jgi:magnesium-transporting ATPase (P-type)
MLRIIYTIKGAQESIFSMSEKDVEMEKKLKEFMSMGYRTIAVAQKQAIDECGNAGGKVIMITGDKG